MSLSPDTYTIQSRLAMYCRDGKEVQLPGLTPDRLSQYRRLVFNIIQDNIESAYPIAYKYLETEIWDDLVYNFFSIHECQNFQVWKLPKEFMEFVIENKYAETYNLPYLNDLLKFEWAEMELYNTTDIPYEFGNLNGDRMNGSINFNPEHILLPLEYPLHMLPPANAMENKGNYFVLLYREKETGKIQFVDLSVWYAFLIEQISQNEVTVNELLEYAPQLFGNISISDLSASTHTFIQSMIDRKFIISIG
jgi:hypothetical protein